MIPREQSTSVKAFFGSSNGAGRVLVSLVVRAPDALEKHRAAVAVLQSRGIDPFGDLYEEIAPHDAWAALSVAIAPAREQEILALYAQEIAPLDTTFSIGVYRVGSQER